MENRNDISKLTAAGVPATTTDFSCGWWGKHLPPQIVEGQITIAVGQGYRSNKHVHGQNVYVVETGERVALIEMRKYGDLYGSGMWHYLVGVDGAAFVAQVPNTIDSLAEALEYLKPVEVKRAEEAGLKVQRQGDWYFVPLARTPRGEVELNQALDDDHIAAISIRTKTVTYVQGAVAHGQHPPVYLDTWHKAIRNKAIRTGRLAQGGGAD